MKYMCGFVILALVSMFISEVKPLQCYVCRGDKCKYQGQNMLQTCGFDLFNNNDLVAHTMNLSDPIIVDGDDSTTTTKEPIELGSYACYAANFDGQLAEGCLYVPYNTLGCEALKNQHKYNYIDNCMTCSFDGCNNVVGAYYVYSTMMIVLMSLLVALIVIIIVALICICWVGCKVTKPFACICCSSPQQQRDLEQGERNEQPKQIEE